MNLLARASRKLNLFNKYANSHGLGQDHICSAFAFCVRNLRVVNINYMGSYAGFRFLSLTSNFVVSEQPQFYLGTHG